MQEVIFDVETITPLFLAGADQETAELRAPSFRGVMRYWYRALVGGSVGTNLDNLKKAEAAVFGTTDRGSAIIIKVSEPDKQPRQFNENISRQGTRQSTGKGYLLWSMKLKQPSRYYFDPFTHFQIHLTTKETDISKFKQGIAAFWLLAQLGGVGSRSRRCAGSLAIKDYKGNVYDFPFGIPATASELKDQIEQGIRIARTACGISHPALQQAQFDILASNTCRIWILQNDRPWRTSEEALQGIGDSYQSYRGTLLLVQRKVFGFPLRGIHGSVDRRASPLLLRVSKLQNNKYVGIAVLFKTPNADIQRNDYRFVEQWVTTRFPNSLEVQL